MKKVAVLAIAVIAAGIGTAAIGQSTGKLEIFSWWTTGGEAAGLLKDYGIFKAANPSVEIINAAVSGGAGSNAKAVLKTRMLGGDPPDSFQVHMGHELIDTWVKSGFMENLDDVYKSENWEKVFPKGVLDLLKYQGHYYSVPSNIHRSNMMFFNTKVFADNGLNVPKTYAQFFDVAKKLQAKGITPLALGDNGIWASVNLFETVLMGTLGPKAYIGLWDGKTDWNGAGVKKALTTFSQMLGYVNTDHAARSWDQANDLVIQGKAAMTVMGDWVDADNLAKKFKDSGWAPAPGNMGIYSALSDSFGIPKKAPHLDQAKTWVKLIGSRQGQEAFNPVKGSICARTDCDPKLFGPYLQWATKQWKTNTVVPSLAHGAAASESWLSSISDAMSLFVTRRDVASTQSALVQDAQDALK